MPREREIVVMSPAVQWEMLFASQADFAPVLPHGREHYFALLDGIGVDTVLEFIASGRLPVELALSNGIPRIIFAEWMDDRVDKAKLKVAMRSHAQVAVLKSQLALQATPDSPAEATVQKELSIRLAWTAERMDPETWGTARKDDRQPPAVNISLNLGGAPPEQLPTDITPRLKIIEG